ncbi:type II secretion system minor pseudopilin GspI [Kangiella sediminilitoris]|uniref:Type II secretion system protein I n=1 Tax=Kangiella sediminilitoris TaxID=1144748 RepID=A0A1B3B8A0_9GAMM|nr:type II secretion system minor pseudopilin GspI [Kangiella sediminilitoris]AOE49023.1 General secretion pathway protein I [Kangiella sediminilitoris]
MMSRLNRKQSGLSLLELLIALAVFSIFIIPMLSGLFSSSIIALGNSKDKTLANFVAQNHFAELQLDDDWPSVGKRRGETEYAGRIWEWEQNVVGTEVEDMRRVTLSILYGESGIYTMTGFVGKKSDDRDAPRR